MALRFWVAASSEWHCAQVSGPTYSFRGAAPLVGHQPGFRKRSSVLDCLSIVAGSCARKMTDEITKVTITKAEQAALIKNSLGPTDGSGRHMENKTCVCLFPFTCTLHNSDVAINGEIRKALDGTTGLRPTHFQPRHCGLLACPQHQAGIMG